MLICRTCGHCCRNTEMELSQRDIQRIEENLNAKKIRRDFYINRNELFYLKNINGHCFFLDPADNFCQIYLDRPTGCRFYPMIYDIDHNRCILDRDCPFSNRFYSDESEFRKNCRLLRNWIYTELLKEPKSS